MARLGRSQPVNWLVRRRPVSLAIPASATLPAGVSMTAGANVSGSAVLTEITNLGPVSIPPATTELDTGVSIVPGGLVTSNAALPIEADVEAVPSAWIFIGQVPLSYLQYTDGSVHLLQANPGQAVVAIGPASGYPYELAVPPADGRWIAVGGGGVVTAGKKGTYAPDPLAWDPPPHLKHLPVPFDVIARRIKAKQR